MLHSYDLPTIRKNTIRNSFTMENRFDELQIANKANSLNTYFRNFEKHMKKQLQKLSLGNRKLKANTMGYRRHIKQAF